MVFVERIEKIVVFGIAGNYGFGKCEGLRRDTDIILLNFEWTKVWKLKEIFFSIEKGCG